MSPAGQLSLPGDLQQQVNQSDPHYHYYQRVVRREGRKVVDCVGGAHGFQPSPIISEGKWTGERRWYYTGERSNARTITPPME